MEAQRERPRVPTKRRRGNSIIPKMAQEIGFENYEFPKNMFVFSEK
jgi:hypothetical protein